MTFIFISVTNFISNELSLNPLSSIFQKCVGGPTLRRRVFKDMKFIRKSREFIIFRILTVPITLCLSRWPKFQNKVCQNCDGPHEQFLKVFLSIFSSPRDLFCAKVWYVRPSRINGAIDDAIGKVIFLTGFLPRSSRKQRTHF